MQAEATRLLKDLIQTPSPSGFEMPLQAIVRRELNGSADQVTTDVMGNVVGIRNPEGKPRVLITGHADEIGLMVKYITDEGFLHFQPIGGVRPGRLEGHRVRVLDSRGPILGVIARKRIQDKDELTKELKHHELWIDIGAHGRAAAEALVRVGDPVVMDAGLEPLQGSLVVGRGFDDRIGVFIVLETMRRLRGAKLDAAVFGVSMVQEEAGSRGAYPGTYAIEPAVGIAIDVHETTDYPTADKRIDGDLALGRGPILARGANFNPVLVDLLAQTAGEHGIPFQWEGRPMPTWTDASVLQIVRGGAATCVIGIPLRYMHTATEIISLDDVESTVSLLVATLPRITGATDFKPV